MTKFSRFVLAHRVAVVCCALLAVALGGGSAALVVQRLTSDFPHSGVAAYEANTAITEKFGGGGGEQRPFVVALTLPKGETAHSDDTIGAVGDAFTAVADQEGARVISYADTRDPALLGDDGQTVAGLVYPGPTSDGSPPGGGIGEVPDPSEGIEEAMRQELPEDTRIQVTGLDALAPGVDAGGINVPLKIGVTALAAVFVLGFVFRSGMALVPVLVACVAVPVSFIALLLLTLVTDVHTQAMTLLPLLGLGLAIDYALLLITRWREERSQGHPGDEAVHRAMATAGRAVLSSAAAVAVGLLTMLVLPVMFLRSLGAAGLIIATASALVTLTLLPVLLAAAGRRADRAEARGRSLYARERAAGAWWSAWGRGVVRYRRSAVVGTGALLCALSVVGLGIDMGVPRSDELARTGPGSEGLETLTDAGIGTGVLTPVPVLVPEGTASGPVAAELAEVGGVATVLSSEGPGWSRGGDVVLSVLPERESGTAAGEETIGRIAEAVPDTAGVGGYAAQNMGLVDATYGAFPLVLALVAAVTFVMLARAFRSLLLPLKAIALNLLSLGAVLGGMVIVWQWGFGSEFVLGMPATGGVGQFVPVTVFAFLYGLSMDYEVFILSRMREEYERTGSTSRAVEQGMGRTGRLVTSAALVLFLSFASMASSGEWDVAVFATGMGLGILLDATLIRGLLLPATVAMMGRWNWWLPVWAARILRVEPSPLREDAHPVDPDRGPAPAGAEPAR